MEDEFDILAAKALAGEASADEQARLNHLLAMHPELQREFAELQKVAQTLRHWGPLAAALDPAPSHVPDVRLRELRLAVQAKFGDAARKEIVTPRLATHTSRFKQLRVWLEMRFGSLGFPVAATALAIIVILSAIALWPPDSAQPARQKAGAVRIGYVVVQRGKAELRHAGHVRPVTTVAALENGDELRLPFDTEVTAITASRAITLTGPNKLAATELASLLSKQSSPVLASKTEPLRVALLESPANLARANLLMTTRASQSIALYSPLGATASLTPNVLWKAEPGKSYDLTITDELNSKTPPWQLSGLTLSKKVDGANPWRGRTLAKSGLYRVRLAETGKPLTACEYTFRTLADGDGQRPVTPIDSLLDAFQLMLSDSGRLGDALAELLMLPADLADSEFALRLKLVAFGRAGYDGDFQSVVQKIQAGQ